MSTASTTKLDATAIGLSVGCAIHCLALPVAAAFLPFLGVVAEAEWVHWVIFAMAVPVTFLAMRHAHTPWPLRVMAAIGLLGLLLGATGWPDHDWETPLTVAGGVVLATAHLVNANRSHARSSCSRPVTRTYDAGEASGS
ncbi:MAG: MerC domain-containing protein [Hyphomonadaceae bacterium]